MRSSQVTHAGDTLHVTFRNVAIAMPAPLDAIIDDHLADRGMSLYGARDTRWRSPAAAPDDT